MAKKQGSPVGWTQFARALPDPDKMLQARFAYASKEDYDAEILSYETGAKQLWVNSKYTVIKEIMPSGLMWLSIRHNDRKPIRDWRHLQRIKNELCGPEYEAAELYPSESRLVDESNQYHLWVLPEGQQFPFGYKSRAVGDSDPAALVGAKQRALEEDDATLDRD